MRIDSLEDLVTVKSEKSGPTRRLLPYWLLAAGVALAAGSLYWYTLAPGTVYLQDVAEFQTKLHTLEVIHATGYPFYQMVGKLWTKLLPLGSIAWRVNLLSAFFSVASLLAICAILQEIDVRPWAILGACALLACSRLFWTYSILASTYTMHVALVSFSILFLLRWQAGRGSGAWFALACGLGLAHHRAFIIVVAALALIILSSSHLRSQLPRRWMIFGALLITPSLLSYLWLVTRGVWPPRQLFHYLFVEGATYVEHVGDLTSWTRRLGETILPWLIDFSGLLPTLAAVAGWLLSIRPSADRMRRRTGFVALAVGVTTVGFFSVAWIRPDNRRYFLQLDLVLALGWGLVLDEGWRWLRRRLNGRWLSPLVQANLAVVALMPLLWRYPSSLQALARYRDGYADRVSRRVLATVESGATVFGGWVLGWPLRYYSSVEDVRPDVQVIVEPGGGHHRDLAVNLIESGEPVYFREAMYGFDQENSGYIWAPVASGGLARVLASGPALAHREELVRPLVEDDLILLSVELSSWPLRPDTFVQLQLAWDKTDEIDDEGRIRLALKDSAGITGWDHDILWSEAWKEDSPTSIYWVAPPTLSPGDHSLHVELQSPAGGSLGDVQIVPVPVAAGPPLAAERLVLENHIQPAKPIPSKDPDLRLLGYSSIQQEIRAGHHQIPVGLYWQVKQIPMTSYQVSLAIEDRGRQIKVSDVCSIEAPYVGALVRTPCVIQVPSGVETGRYRLIAEVSDGQECWAAPLREVRLSDRTHVYRAPAMQHELSVVLEDDISLLGYDLSSQTARPGEDLTVTLYWRAEADGEGWFKVFTHVVGAQGTLLTQHDGVPDSGAAPTSEWISGEVIVDHHRLPIPVDASEGEYRVFVGLYSPDTGERLIARGTESDPYPDRAVPLETITVEAE